MSGSPLKKVGKTREQIINDIKSVFSDYDVKIILFVREHVSWLVSLYKQYVHSGGTKRFGDFIDMVDEVCEYNYGEGLYEAYGYAPYIDLLHERFGKGSVFVETFERLKANPRAVIESLSSFLGESTLPPFKQEKRNVGFGATQLQVARQLNKLWKTPMDSNGLFPFNLTPFILKRRLFFRLFPQKFDISKEWKDFLAKKFRIDKDLLKKKHGLSFD